jgi:hypothetical protein
VTGAALGILRPLYRHALGEQLSTVVGRFGVFYATTTNTGGEARSRVTIDDLIDEEAARDALAGSYVYIADGDQAGHQGRVLRNGYHGSSGLLEITPPTDAAVAAGSTVELSAPLPCEARLGVPGLNQIVNWALERTIIEAITELTGDGTRSVSLLDQESVLDINERADAVFDDWAVPTGDPLEATGEFRLVDADGAERTLITRRDYGAGETHRLRALRAGHTLIKTGETWANSTVGLTSDAQAAAVPIPWVVAIGMVKACSVAVVVIRREASLDPAERDRQTAALMAARMTWARAARKIRLNQFPRPTPPARDAIVSVTDFIGLSIPT